VRYTQHECHHDTKVKPEAATAVIELLMMGGKTLETCRAVNKRQDNKLENCCIRLVIHLKYTHIFKFMRISFAKDFFQTSSFSWSLLECKGHYLFFVLDLRKNYDAGIRHNF
jgi:hypothetical protein